MRGPSGHPLLRDRQRDPGPDRALARQGARSRGSSNASTGRPRRRTPRASSPTSTTPRPSTSSCPSSTSPPSTSSSRTRRPSSPTWRACRTSAGDRPLLITEVGLDSRRNGERGPGRGARLAGPARLRHRRRRRLRLLLDRRVAPRRARGDDWDFGLVDRERRPKPSLGRDARRLRRGAVLRRRARWPRVSVVVCTHNGARTLPRVPRAACAASSYPDFEVIVVDDGSSDGSAEIARAPRRDAGRDRAPRPQRRPQRRDRRRAERGDRRLPRRRRLPRPATGSTTSPRSLRANGHAGIGGPNIPPRRRPASPSASPPRRAGRSTS